MKRGYRKNSLLVAGFTVLFLHLQVVKAQVTYLRERSGDIKNRNYPQNYSRGYLPEWRIEAPRGYRIRLKFKDFKVGNCNSGDFLDVWDGRRLRELCGQQLPSTIESVENKMEISVYSGRHSIGGRFWAQYETFDKNELKTTPRFILYTTVQPKLPDTSPSRGSGNIDGEQRLYLLLTMMGCVIVAIIAAILCGCKRKRRPHLHSHTPTDNANLENQVHIAELNFDADPPPSYEEVTRQSISGITSNTQGPVGENTGGEVDQVIDSSGLPSYREAVRLSQQSLNANG